MFNRPSLHGPNSPGKNVDLIRELILNPYRLIYQIDQEMKIIHILRIWHSYRGTPEIQVNSDDG
ncbi:type II toxin-antitoxin system RelE/ParE family toxin [Candidatus Sumerlaeota bacterium]|nr:type II toxin-antitoxin system RelE/ParE family toxin [Candidatus Sumerlaeota bacterium]